MANYLVSRDRLCHGRWTRVVNGACLSRRDVDVWQAGKHSGSLAMGEASIIEARGGALKRQKHSGFGPFSHSQNLCIDGVRERAYIPTTLSSQVLTGESLRLVTRQS